MLALWEYFWNAPDWVPGPPPPVTVPPTNDSQGSSRGKYFRPPVDPWLERTSHDQEYWDLRERYLRRFMEPALKAERVQEVKIRESSPIKYHEDKLSAGQTHLALLQQARDAVVSRARIAATETELRNEVARVIKLTLDISNLRIQYYERAAIILLLDLF
jgi:hypothetical protein